MSSLIFEYTHLVVESSINTSIYIEEIVKQS